MQSFYLNQQFPVDALISSHINLYGIRSNLRFFFPSYLQPSISNTHMSLPDNALSSQRDIPAGSSQPPD